MTDLFDNDPRRDPEAPARKSPLPSSKQRRVIEYLRQHGSITTKQAVELIGRNLYANAAHHVGATLRRMVARGMIERVKPGLFTLKTP